MSPYLFILCIYLLSKYICHQVNIGLWDPIQLSQSGPPLSHLFNADDLTLEANSNVNSIQTINQCLVFFSQLLCQ